MRLGKSMLASVDPTVPGITEALERNEYPRLVVGKQTAQGVATTVSMIQIHALHIGNANDPTAGEDFLKLRASSSVKMGQRTSNVEAPENFSVEGRTFWKTKIDLAENNSVLHEAASVNIEKGYLLYFLLLSPDAKKLDDLVGTMQSLHFSNPSP